MTKLWAPTHHSQIYSFIITVVGSCHLSPGVYRFERLSWEDKALIKVQFSFCCFFIFLEGWSERIDGFSFLKHHPQVIHKAWQVLGVVFLLQTHQEDVKHNYKQKGGDQASLSDTSSPGVNWFHVVQINLFLFVHHCAPLLCEYPWWTFVRLYRPFWFYMYSCLSHLSSSHPVLTLNSSCSLNIFAPSYLFILYNLYVN